MPLTAYSQFATGLRRSLRRFGRSLWLFPVLITVPFMVLTVLQISGSSEGYYHSIFYPNKNDSNIIAGQPRPVRSDEWLVASQKLLEQKAANYPAVNKNVGLGEDESLVDVPFRSFFVLFKPHNLFFFVLPFNMAFAAKWWFMSLTLALGFYFLMTALFPKKRLLASLGGILLVFNPFVQWWYATGTLLTLGYALWACFFAVKLFSEDSISRPRLLLYSGGLAFSTLSFIFVLYPPFQLAVGYVIAALLAGFFYHRYRVRQVPIRDDKNRWAGMAAAALAVLVILGSFYATHKQTVRTINGTAYPGVRNILSGGDIQLNMSSTFSAPVLYNIQNEQRGISYYTNQSEASRIVLLNLFLLPVALYIICKKPRAKRGLADYLLLSTSVLAGVFMIRIFTPFFNLPFKLLLFNKVQIERLAIGLALLCVVQLVLIGLVVSRNISFKKAGLTAVFTFAFCLDASLMMAHRYPNIIPVTGTLVACLIIGVAAFLMLRQRLFIIGLALFVIFNIASSMFVNPLYAHSEPTVLQNITNHIATKYTDKKNWITVDSVIFENIPLLAGEHSLSGLEYYPQLALWQKLDPKKAEINTYNRYAHVFFTASLVPANQTFYSPQPDVVGVKFNCDTAKKLPNFGYALSSAPITGPALGCLKLDDTMAYPIQTLYVYKYQP